MSRALTSAHHHQCPTCRHLVPCPYPDLCREGALHGRYRLCEACTPPREPDPESDGDADHTSGVPSGEIDR